MTFTRNPESKSISLQERVIAEGMRQKIGDVTTRYVLAQGARIHPDITFIASDLGQLADEFSRDPKNLLAYARENLFAVAHDKQLTQEQRKSRLDRYFDAYVDLTLRLDHKAFLPTPHGLVEKGTPEYVPDGFIDMGGDNRLDVAYRGREQILVDKREILEKYAPTLKEIFSADYSHVANGQKKRHMATWLAHEVYYRMPYDYSFTNYGGGEVPLSKLDEGVCRHQALVFQVLSQSVGLTTRLLKATMNGVRHSTNMVRFDGQWYIADVTAPDSEDVNGIAEWRPARFKIDNPPAQVSDRTYNVTEHFRGKRRTYVSHDQMYWRIDNMSS